jgi:GNAT superfamily N-acetyltransferase
VRRGRPEDRDTIVGFQVAMAWETEELALNSETVTAGVQGVFDDSTRGEYWIAECEGEVVGSLLTVPEWSDWRNGAVLWIHSVYVIPGARKQGVFRTLYENLRERVKSSDDLKGLRLYVETGNGNAQKVYEQMGMSADHYQLFEWLK